MVARIGEVNGYDDSGNVNPYKKLIHELFYNGKKAEETTGGQPTGNPSWFADAVARLSSGDVTQCTSTQF